MSNGSLSQEQPCGQQSSGATQSRGAQDAAGLPDRYQRQGMETRRAVIAGLKLNIKMQFWGTFLAIAALLVSVAQLWDKHYLKTKTSSGLRDRLIRFYLMLDERTPYMSKDDVKEIVLLPVRLVVPSVILYGGILYIAHLISETLYGVLLVFAIGLFAPIALVFLGAFVFSVFAVIALFYVITRWVLVHFLDKMSDPKTSPFTYLLSMLSLAAAAAKAAIEIIKFATT